MTPTTASGLFRGAVGHNPLGLKKSAMAIGEIGKHGKASFVKALVARHEMAPIYEILNAPPITDVDAYYSGPYPL